MPIEDFRLPAVGHSLTKPAEGGLGQNVRPKPSGLGTIRMLGENLVSTRAVVLASFVLDDGEWHRVRRLNDRLREIAIRIGEDAITVRTVPLIDPDGFVWVRRWSGCAFVARTATRRGVAGGVAASTLVFGLVTMFVLAVVVIRLGFRIVIVVVIG